MVEYAQEALRMLFSTRPRRKVNYTQALKIKNLNCATLDEALLSKQIYGFQNIAPNIQIRARVSVGGLS